MHECKYSYDYGFLQNFIYFMNSPTVRNEIIRKFYKTQPSVEWWGTFYVSGPKHKLVVTAHDNRVIEESLLKFFQEFSKQLKNNKINIYTICYQYENNHVHYITDVYDNRTQSIYHFDPGVSLYEHGQKTIIPSWERQYKNLGLLKTSTDLGTCHTFSWKGKKMGVQYDGSSGDFPADAFCQTWTIFFLYRLSFNISNYNFVKQWCGIRPSKRKAFLISNFIIPFLTQNKKYYQSVLKMGKLSKKIAYIDILFDIVEKCAN